MITESLLRSLPVNSREKKRKKKKGYDTILPTADRFEEKRKGKDTMRFCLLLVKRREKRKFLAREKNEKYTTRSDDCTYERTTMEYLEIKLNQNFNIHVRVIKRIPHRSRRGRRVRVPLRSYFIDSTEKAVDRSIDRARGAITTLCAAKLISRLKLMLKG